MILSWINHADHQANVIELRQKRIRHAHRASV